MSLDGTWDTPDGMDADPFGGGHDSWPEASDSGHDPGGIPGLDGPMDFTTDPTATDDYSAPDTSDPYGADGGDSPADGADAPSGGSDTDTGAPQTSDASGSGDQSSDTGSSDTGAPQTSGTSDGGDQSGNSGAGGSGGDEPGPQHGDGVPADGSASASASGQDASADGSGSDGQDTGGQGGGGGDASANGSSYEETFEPISGASPYAS